MPVLNDKVIIYDDSCPMCKLYTHVFVRMGILKPDNRIGFAQADLNLLNDLDLDRARHEIPLYDRTTRQTVYGLDALYFVLGSRWPLLKPIFRLRFTQSILKPVYRVITFNRRVMAGCGSKNGFDCAPDFDSFYRRVYLGLVVMIVSAILVMLGLLNALATESMVGGLVVMAFLGGLGWLTQVGLARWDWFGNLASMSLVFSFSLIPIGLLVRWDCDPIYVQLVTSISYIVLGLEMHRRLIGKFGVSKSCSMLG